MNQLLPNIPVVTRIAETLAIGLSTVPAFMIRSTNEHAGVAITTLLSVIIYSFMSELTGANSDLRLRPFYIEARRVAGAWCLTFGCLLLVGWAVKYTENMSRLYVGFWAIFAVGLLIAVRWGIRNQLFVSRRKGKNLRPLVLIGAGDVAQRWIRTVLDYPELGLNPVAAFDDDPRKIGTQCQSVPILGTCDQAASYVNQNGAPIVMITLPLRATPRIQHVFSQFLDSPANVYITPDIFTFQLMNLNAFQVGNMPVIAMSTSPMNARKEALKRFEDIILGFLALIFFAPVMLFIAAGIRLDSAGPIFFRQWRYGLDGKRFQIWKFRTMHVMEDGNECAQATRDDCRTTRLGRLLRRTSLDELPQLFNVLDGSMSLVGPRPHAVAHDERYRALLPGYIWRLKIKPGITGWAQVNGWRGETDTVEKMAQRIRHDVHYIENWTLTFDIRILWLTIWKGFANKNAY